MQQQNRRRRLARYEAVMELVRKGVSQREIARQCSLSRKTVRRWIRAQKFPECRHGRRYSTVEPLFAAFDALQGQVISMCDDRHRHQEWLKFLRGIATAGG